MPHITVSQLESKIRLEVRGSMIVSFFAETIPDMRVRGNPYICPSCRLPVVKKCARVNGVLNANYARSVNRQRVREGQPAGTRRRSRSHTAGRQKPGILYFRALPRKWGEQEDGYPLIHYRGEVYLALKRERVLRVGYRLLDTMILPESEQDPDVESPHVLFDDQKFQQIESFIRQRTSESKRQQTKKPIVKRDYMLRNIRQIDLGGTTYEIKRPPRRKAKAA